MKELFLSWLSRLPFGNYLDNRFVSSGLILIIAVIVARLLLLVFEKGLDKFAKHTKTDIDDLIFEKTKRPLFYLILVYGLKLSLHNLGINGMVSKSVNSLMAIVFVFIIAKAVEVIISVWGRTVAKKTKSRFDDVLLPLFHKVANVIFIIIAILWVLDVWEINITPYLAGAGIAGVVLGLALQDSLKNVFGGITLLLDKTFEIGDKVRLESGDIGTIHDIGLRSTKLVTYDNEVIYIPNGYLANSRIQNYTRPSPKVRVWVTFGVEYGNNIGKVRKTVLEVLNKMEGVLPEPAPAVQFLEMGNFALQFKTTFWVERWNVAYDKKLEATEKIYNALNKAKINIPFPTQTIYLKK